MRTIDRDIVGAFIFSKDDQILLGKGGVYPGKWIVPGGGIEPGETKLAALKREILEETGIDISGDKVEALKEVLEGESQKTLRDSGERVLVKMRFYNYTVHMSRPAAKVALKSEDDFIDAQWFPVADLSKMSLSPPSTTTLQMLGYLPKPSR